MKARVLQTTGSWYKLETETGDVLDGRLRGKLRLSDLDVTNPVAVGDLVSIEIEEDNTASIFEIEDRRNLILRQSTRQGKHVKNQIIAANVDLAVAVQAAAKPVPKPGFIDRFLVSCEAYGVEPAIVFNKMDLSKGKKEQKVNELTSIYLSLGYTVLHTSIQDPGSIEAFSGLIKDKLVVLVGHSGVGKSSLINAIDPELNLKIAEVSKSSEKGRHTTTFAQLHRLSNGAMLVDTPGIREFGLVNIEPGELSLYFPEMKTERENCRFYNCTHEHEPGCSVIQKVEEGMISSQRYESYLNILYSL